MSLNKISKKSTSTAPLKKQKPATRKVSKKSPEPAARSERFQSSKEESGPVSKSFSGLISGLKDNFVEEKAKSAPTSGLFDGVTDFVGDRIEDAGDALGGARDVAGDVLDEAGDFIGDRVDDVRDLPGNIKEGLEDIGGGVRDFGEGVLNRIGGLFGRDDRLAEEREDDPTIAVIDSFGDADSETTHGELVESIIQDNSGATEDDIQRYKAGGTLGVSHVSEADDDELGSAFDEYVESFSADSLNGSSDAIQDILSDENSSVRTINQSLAAPEVRIAENLYNELNSNSEFRERYLDYAGLDSSAEEREILKTLVSEVSDSRRNNDRIKEAQERYDGLTREAQERGIVTVVASGNHGRFADTLESHGVTADDEFFQNNLVNDYTLAVGATDGMNTPGANDDSEAVFTTPQAGAEIAAPGQDISTFEDGETRTASGTSFSAPQVAAAASEIAARYPELSARQIESILIKSSQRTKLDSEEIGYGVLDSEAALTLAERVAA
jgi:subtilisin family serine protease